MSDNTTAIIYLSILISLLIAVKKYASIRIVKAEVWGLEGAGGTIHRLVKLDMVREGNFLKDSMTGRQIPIVTNTITISQKKKEKSGFLVDLENGCTIEIHKDPAMMNIITQEAPESPQDNPEDETSTKTQAAPGIAPAPIKRTFTVKTNPDLISNVLDSRIITDAFAIKPNRGMLIACLLIGMVIGLVMGKAF